MRYLKCTNVIRLSMRVTRVFLGFAGNANQTAFERVSAPGYERRPDVRVAALTLQLPLEGKLRRGGVVGVIKTADGRWIHAQQHGAQPDFFISTREARVIPLLPESYPLLPASVI